MNDDTDVLTAGIRSLQFGDENDPAHRANIQRMVRQEALNAQQQVRQEAELAANQRVLARFQEENADLVNDRVKKAAMEGAVFEMLEEDCARHGFTAEKLKQMLGRDPAPKDVADCHLWLRSEGKDVRSVERFLAEAAERVSGRMGSGPTMDGRETGGPNRNYTPVLAVA
jgi:hypothetical protein